MSVQRLSSLPGTQRASVSSFIPPQLATLVKEPPPGDLWLHELKLDGYRMLCRLDRKRVTVFSRDGLNWTRKFQNINSALAKLNVRSALLDGEIVIIDANGRSSFHSLQRAMNRKTLRGFTYFIFDLLYLNGYDLRHVPLSDRKELLSHILAGAGDELRFVEHYQGDGLKFFEKACRYSVEGVVSKLADSIYDSGRSRSWLKTKCNLRQEFVVAGYTRSSSGLPGFSSLVLGVHDDNGRLTYAGRVGTGFTLKQRRSLKTNLDAIARPNSPLVVGPVMRNTQWVKPVLVAEVSFTEWTADNSIRHPSFQGLRKDKKPNDVIRESPIGLTSKHR